MINLHLKIILKLRKKIKDSENRPEKLKENKKCSFCDDDGKKDKKKTIKNQKNNKVRIIAEIKMKK